MNHPDPKRQVEIGNYMTAHLWVAEWVPSQQKWVMSKEPYAYSQGPFEVMAIAQTLEEAFDKAKIQQEGLVPTAIQKQVDELTEQAIDDWAEQKHAQNIAEAVLDEELDERSDEDS